LPLVRDCAAFRRRACSPRCMPADARSESSRIIPGRLGPGGVPGA
jgi:hypothetical protein